jgi:hypothetical protein
VPPDRVGERKLLQPMRERRAIKGDRKLSRMGEVGEAQAGGFEHLRKD